VSSRTEWSQCPIGQERGKLATKSCKGKGWSKKLSKKWTGPYTIIEVCSPQVVVLEEPNSRNRLTVNIEQIKPFNAATPTTLNSSLNYGHYKVEEALKEHTTDTGITRSSGLATPTATIAGSQKGTFMPTVYLRSSKQVGAQQPQAECRALRLVGGR